MPRMVYLSITVTLGTYGHLFPKIEERIDDGLDAVYRETVAPTAALVRELEAPGGRANSS